MLNTDHIFHMLNRLSVDYILIGGMNFLLRHKPVLTFDVDIWIDDTRANRRRCEEALVALEAEWGPTEETWGPVAAIEPDWLARQSLFALTTSAGPVDVFRRVAGLPNWQESRKRAEIHQTAKGTEYCSLSDADMLACQYALQEQERKLDRIRYLEQVQEES